LEFANFLEGCDDIVSFAKNYYEVHFKIDYKNADGSISYYYPDFFVKIDNKNIYIVEAKGYEIQKGLDSNNIQPRRGYSLIRKTFLKGKTSVLEMPILPRKQK